MRSGFCGIAILALLGCAVVAAQTPPAAGRHHPAMQQHMDTTEADMLGMRELRIAAALKLTDDQQTKIGAAFDEAATFRRDMVAKSTELRAHLETAVKSGDEATIDSVSHELADLLGEQIAFQAKTVARVYGVLTDEQRARLAAEVRRSLGVNRPHGRVS